MKRYIVLLSFLFLLPNLPFAGRPDSAPAPLLIIEGLGNGFSTPSITRNRIFVTGELDGTGYLFAYDFNGRQLWKTTYGKEWTVSFRGSRASPVVADSLIYTVSGMGDITCFDILRGEKQWGVNMIRDFHGVNAVFGYSMSLLIEEGRIYCLPGGPDTNIACLDRYTGQIIWTSKGNGEPPGYATPLLIRHNDRKLLVAFSELAMHGLDAATGELLWTYDLSFKGEVPCNKPIYSEGFLYIVAGPGNGAVKFEISKDGSHIKKVWSNIEFDTFFGGFVMNSGFLYGSSNHQRKWMSIDASTGRAAGSLSFRTGATVSAGEDLVLYNQSGEVAIVRLAGGKMTPVRSFAVSEGTNEHFTLPVFGEERLFIRHGNALLVYDYKQLATDYNTFD